MRKIISNNYLDEIFCEESTLLSEQILNEGRIYDTLKWKIFRFSVRFLTEDSMDEFLYLYYEKTKNDQAIKNIPKMSKKEKIEKIQYVLDKIPVEDRHIVNKIKIPEDFLNRKSNVHKNVNRRNIAAGSAAAGIGTLTNAAGISLFLNGEVLALIPTILLTVLSIVGGAVAITSIRKSAKRFRVESIEKVKEYFGIRHDKEEPTKSFDDQDDIARKYNMRLMPEKTSAVLHILEIIERDIKNDTIETVRPYNNLKDSVKKIMSEPGEFSVEYDLWVLGKDYPTNGHITIYKNNQKVSFELQRNVSDLNALHVLATKHPRGISTQQQFQNTKYITGVEYFKLDNKLTIRAIFDFKKSKQDK